MLKIKLTAQGQAATEMAVFGSLILICFTVLLSYGQTFTEQQALQQQAFRRALRRAHDDNGFISYNIIKNPRNVNLFGGFREGERGSISAGSSVLWNLGEPENRAYYQINEDLIEIPRYNKKTKNESAPTPAEVWDVQTGAESEYLTHDTRQENSAMIRTGRDARLTDTITTTLKLRYQKKDGGSFSDAPDRVMTQGLGPQGRYSQASVGAAVTGSRTWETPHPEE